MIEQSVLTALAANFVFALPFYKTFTAPRYKETRLALTKGREEYESAKTQLGFTHPEHKNRRLAHEYDYPGQTFDIETDVRHEFYITKQINFFARKPFNCLLCMTFWGALVLTSIGSFIVGSNLISTVDVILSICFTAPFLSELINRVFKALPLSV